MNESRCPQCKAPVPEYYRPGMVCAMCLRFGADRNDTRGEDLNTWRRGNEKRRAEDHVTTDETVKVKVLKGKDDE